MTKHGLSKAEIMSSESYQRACSMYRKNLMKSAEFDQEFMVDQRCWSDELRLTDAIQAIFNSNIEKSRPFKGNTKNQDLTI